MPISGQVSIEKYYIVCNAQRIYYISIIMQKVIIYNFAHNGDLFHAMPFIKILVSQNSNLFFTFYIINTLCNDISTLEFHYLFHDIINKYNNANIEHYDVYKNSKNIWNNSHYAQTFIIDDCIYINLFSVLLPSLNGWDCDLINNNSEPIWNLDNRIKWLSYYKEYFYNITKININLNATTTLDMMTLLPRINIDEHINTIKNLKYKKNIFFYNQYGGWDNSHTVQEDNIIFEYIFNHYNDVNIITSKKTDIKNNNIYCVESLFDSKPTPCGKNLIINAEIANLCDIIFFRLNGGTEFIFSRNFIDNTNTQYIYIGNKKYLSRIHNLRSDVIHLDLIK